jgi:hypothetical protein
MTFKRFMRERSDDIPPDQSSADEQADDDLAEEAERISIGLQNVLDSGQLDYSDANAVGYAIKLLAQLTGRYPFTGRG